MSTFDFLRETALPRPAVGPEDAARILAERYGISGELRELGSNQDRNFLVDAGDRRAVLKLSNPVFGEDELTAQNLAADAVVAAGVRAPACLPSVDGRTIEPVEVGGIPLRARLLEFVEGEPLTGTGAFSPADAAALGELSARVALALRSVSHPGAAQRTQWNLRIAGEVVDLLAPGIPDDALRERVATVSAEALAALAPLRDELRTQVIHGDVTDDNAVRGQGGAIDGVIDFGDVAESWTVAELAVTCASLLHHNPRSPFVVLDAIAAFHALLPLTDAELDALWPLVRLRAAVLIASGEHQVALDAGNAYADENRAQERRGFDTAERLEPDAMRALIAWRLGGAATGPAAAPAQLLVDAGACTRLDLSSTSPALDGGVWLEPGVEARLLAQCPAVTSWGEARMTRSVPRSAREVATVALGVELALPAAVPVTAPWAGSVRREGGALVLTGDGVELWVTGLALGDGVAGDARAVAAGDVLGEPAAHPAALHVQLSRAPGIRPPAFAVPSEADIWREACPDPSALLGLPGTAPDPAAGAAGVLATRDAAFASVQEHYYAHPPRIERGWREHFVDTDGQTYVDMVNNVATAGHGHPRIAAAVARQWSLHNTNSRFHYGAVAEFSARLAALAPDPLDTVFLVNSGSEAVDLALRLATVVSGRPDVLAVREAYHGWTIGSDAVSSSIGDNPRALSTRPSWVRLADAPNTYRGTHRGPDAGKRYLADLLADLDRFDAEGARIGGFIAEPVFGNAGGVLLPDGYLAGAYAAIRERGGLCIADEVQVGYGRLGSYFWGHEQQGVVPDIITIAKAMGNGHPLGAVITTREIAEAFAAEGSMFSSAGGSPVSCVVGMTVLDIMEDEDLVENARIVGGHLRARLEELATRHELIGAVHGMGLYLGVELVRSRATLEPATAEAAALCDAMLREGCIVQPTGDHKNVLKIKPPMLLSRESADFFADGLDRVLGSLEVGAPR